jgi:hypothetical protein
MKQNKKQVYTIKRDNFNLGYLYESPTGKVRQSTNKRVMGGNIVSEALRGLPDNMELVMTFKQLPDNKITEEK